MIEGFYCTGHCDCLGHDPLDDRGHLEQVPLGRGGSGALSDLGIYRDGTSVEHHVLELGSLSGSHSPNTVGYPDGSMAIGKHAGVALSFAGCWRQNRSPGDNSLHR